ncbi:hypothetical protein PRIPAC_71479, partial [Pristionchus pacificus]|uniref:G protein-coupled receptor n=1 Tax=Pristionchus pacificus TaxID=54126 RepID=A0A2A6C196_PRIPA
MEYIKILSRIEQINYYIGAYKYLQKMVTKGHAFAFFLLSFDGGNLYFVALFGGLFSLILVIVNFNFLYRYWAVVSPHLVQLFSTVWFTLVLFLFTLVEFIVWYSSCFFLYIATPEVRVDMVPEMDCKYGLDALTHPMVVGDYWRDGYYNWRPMTGLAIFSTIITAGFAFMMFSSFSILRRLGTAKAMSAKTKRMQYALFRMLTVQRFRSFSFMATPVRRLFFRYSESRLAGWLILLRGSVTISLSDSCPTVISFFPPLDALAVILLMRDYRETVLNPCFNLFNPIVLTHYKHLT